MGLCDVKWYTVEVHKNKSALQSFSELYLPKSRLEASKSKIETDLWIMLYWS